MGMALEDQLLYVKTRKNNGLGLVLASLSGKTCYGNHSGYCGSKFLCRVERTKGGGGGYKRISTQVNCDMTIDQWQ